MIGDDNMKIAKCNFERFEDSGEDLKLKMDDVFVVSESFEENPRFIDGLRIGAFEIVNIEKIGELKKVIGVTDEMIDEFMDAIEDEDDDEDDELTVAVDEAIEKAEAEAVPDETPEPEVELPPAEEDEPEDEVIDTDEEDEDEVPDEPALAFTEEANGWQEAVALVKEETDVEKLTFALRKDERKSVQKACIARLAELADEKE